MTQAQDNFIAGALAARKLAADYRAEAETTTDTHRRAVCLWEAQEADDRADWYEEHANLFTAPVKAQEAA